MTGAEGFLFAKGVRAALANFESPQEYLRSPVVLEAECGPQADNEVMRDRRFRVASSSRGAGGMARDWVIVRAQRGTVARLRTYGRRRWDTFSLQIKRQAHPQMEFSSTYVGERKNRAKTHKVTEYLGISSADRSWPTGAIE